MKIIVDENRRSKDMPPYNWYELGPIRNVSEEDQLEFCNKPIYQILPVKYLIKIIRNQKLRFNNIVRSWEDPYELFLLKQNIEIESWSKNHFSFKLLNNYYGQCWSLTEDSDAIWRIYSFDKESVRIKTSVIKIINVLDQKRGMKWYVPYFGKVDYKNTVGVVDWMNEALEGGSGTLLKAFADSLFIKRSEFAHENEVRFIVSKPIDEENNTNPNVFDSHIDFGVDPYNFIEEIALDPRLSDEDFEDRKALLSSITREIPIVKSNLYQFQPQNYIIKETPMHLDVIVHDEK